MCIRDSPCSGDDYDTNANPMTKVLNSLFPPKNPTPSAPPLPTQQQTRVNSNQQGQNTIDKQNQKSSQQRRIMNPNQQGQKTSQKQTIMDKNSETKQRQDASSPNSTTKNPSSPVSSTETGAK